MGQPAEPGHISLGQAVTLRGLAARPAYGRVTGPGCDVLGQSVRTWVSYRSWTRDCGHVTRQSWGLRPLWVSSPPKRGLLTECPKIRESQSHDDALLAGYLAPWPFVSDGLVVAWCTVEEKKIIACISVDR